jgi:hypothetical protein
MPFEMGNVKRKYRAGRDLRKRHTAKLESNKARIAATLKG